jgi:hypothetical protein
MNTKIKIAFIVTILIHLFCGCATKWTKAIQYGKIANKDFNESIAIEIDNGLIFLPVSINGKKYRFLFDSGAPFSISEQLQSEYSFKNISSGTIVDSDLNKEAINWVSVDAINIGEVTFTGQTAFIGDFQANPILKCLGIDGIIGSNVIRQCNWTIDQAQKSLRLFSTIDAQMYDEHTVVPFITDDQYNIFINLNIGQSTIKNILVDYGSVGAVSLSDEIFEVLKDRKTIDKIFTESGTNQSGIVGKAVALNRKNTITDAVELYGQPLKNVLLRTGKTVSVGNAFLSRFKVTMDWTNKKFYITKNKTTLPSNEFLGFKLGYSASKGVFVQSVIENSNAFKKGIRPDMKVLKIDNLDFSRDDDFCAYVRYVRHEFGKKIFVQFIDFEGKTQEYHVKKLFTRSLCLVIPMQIQKKYQ